MMKEVLLLDGKFLIWIQETLRCEGMHDFWRAVTSLGDSGWFWIVLSLLLLLFPKTRRAGMLALLSMAFCALITNVCLKNLVMRPRPYTQLPELKLLIGKPSDWSFPSGHTTAAFAAACSYWRVLPEKRFTIPVLLLAGMIAFSRLYLGVHYPTDVLAGLLVGVFGSALVYRGMLAVREKRITL